MPFAASVECSLLMSDAALDDGDGFVLLAAADQIHNGDGGDVYCLRTETGDRWIPSD